jgi:TRAP-type C4-dicarboxylate transport system substrate-binding protein
LCALIVFASAAEAKTLKIATIMPDGSSWLVKMQKASEQIAQKTEGRVKLKFYPGGVMGNDKTVLRKVRAGQLQGGAFTSGALAAVYPDMEIYSLPLLFRSYDEVDYVRAQMDESLRAGLSDAGFVALSVSDGGFAYILSNKPLRRVEDMSQAKMWLPEGDVMSAIALDLAGVSSVPLATVDVYTALQTGLIDTVGAPPMAAIAFQWHTKVSYLTDVPLMYLVGLLAVERKTFEKLLPGDQAIVRVAIAEAARQLDEESRASDQNAKEALRNQGIQFVMASSDEELARWRRISEEAIAEIRTTGRYSESIIEELLGHLADFRAMPQASRTPAQAPAQSDAR